MTSENDQNRPIEIDEAMIEAFMAGKLDDTQSQQVADYLESRPELLQHDTSASAALFLSRLRKVPRTWIEKREAKGTPGNTPGPSNNPKSDELPVAADRFPDYEIVKELGRGGMGVVYLAKSLSMDRLEVLKVLSERLVSKPDANSRFRREIRAVSKLNHPSIVIPYSVLPLESPIVFAMEYVQGLDLLKFIKKNHPIPVPYVVAFTQQIAAGLQHAFEKGLVHRDIKPSNIMVHKVDGKLQTKILDFGLAKATSEKLSDGLTQDGVVLGTAEYVAPEQIINPSKADIRADIYSLGCSVYHLLVGKPPFNGSVGEVMMAQSQLIATPINLLRPDVPLGLVEIVDRMMAKEPSKRYQTPDEVTAALDAWRRKFKSREPTSSPIVEDIQPTLDMMSLNQVKNEPAGPTQARLKTVAASASETAPTTIPPVAKNSIVRSRWQMACMTGGILLLGALSLVYWRRSPRPQAQSIPPIAAELITPEEPSELKNSIGIRFVLVEPGEFVMGSPLDEPERSIDEVPHRVRITKPYYLGKYEVTKGQYRRFVEESGHAVSTGWDDPGFPQTEDHPAVHVSWNDAQAFVDWLSAKEKKRYRLPSEAEWEFAARGGGKPSDSERPEYVGNFEGYADGYSNTAPVGSFPGNAIGLFDMLGNAREWCRDWHSQRAYIEDSQIDPHGPKFGWNQVHRGGGWKALPKDQRIACRDFWSPSKHGYTQGFRVALDRDEANQQDMIIRRNAATSTSSNTSLANPVVLQPWPSGELMKFLDPSRLVPISEQRDRLEAMADGYEVSVRKAKEKLLKRFDMVIEELRTSSEPKADLISELERQRTAFESFGLIPFGKKLRAYSEEYMKNIESAAKLGLNALADIESNSMPDSESEKRLLQELKEILRIPRVVGGWDGFIPHLKGTANNKHKFQWTLFSDGTFSDDFYLGAFSTQPNYRWDFTPQGIKLTQMKVGPWEDTCEIDELGTSLIGNDSNEKRIEAKLIVPSSSRELIEPLTTTPQQLVPLNTTR